MKKIIFIVSFLVYSLSIFAQLEKGMKSIGLSSGFNYNKSTNNKNTTVNSAAGDYNYTSYSYAITPTVSYFLSSKFAIGLSIGYSGSTKKSETTNTMSYYNTNDLSNHIQYKNTHTKDVTNGITVSPFVKYYIPLSDNVFFFLKGNIGTTFSQTKHSSADNIFDLNTTTNVSYTNIGENGPDKTSSIGFNVGISPGILFLPTKKIGLEFSIGNALAYNFNRPNLNITEKINGFEFLNINSMSVGTAIYYFF